MGKNKASERSSTRKPWKVYSTPEPETIDGKLKVTHGSVCEELNIDDLTDTAVKLLAIKRDLERLAKPA